MSSPDPVSPPRPRVPWNRWDSLDVPALGQWTPARTVSVVMPYYQAPDALRLTLAAFTRQTYPKDLLQIVVADDGSNPPAEVPADLDLRGLRVDIVHQEDLGFGLARARNTGAKAAEGDILVFVDCDMVPEPWHVEAHARWHHVAADLATLGFRKHVEFDGIDADTLANVDPAEGLAPLFADRPVQVPEWIDGHMLRTDDLTSAHDDLFRPLTGGNLGMRAETYWRVGGSDESFTQWGAEDTELGFRLFTDGVVLVPDRDARCWHQGHGHEPTPEEVASLDEQRAKLSHLIAHRGFRSSQRGRHYVVPRVAVRVPVAPDDGRQAVADTVEAILAGGFTDLHVVIDLDGGHPDATWLTRQFDPDPAVSVETGVDLDAAFPHTPIQMAVPVGTLVGEQTIAQLVAALENADDPVGAVHVTVPERDPEHGLLDAWLTRARRRAARLTDDPASIAPLVGELFGERWLAGTELGIRARGQDAATASQATAAGTAQPASLDEVAELWDVFRTLDPAERDAIIASAKTGMKLLPPSQRRLLLKAARRIVLVAAALGQLVRARSVPQARKALAEVLKAALPWAVVKVLRDLWRARPQRRR